jgi:AcrR family transcriptional regulator
MTPPAGAQAPGELPAPTGARDRISAAAYELFSRGGIRGVGVDAILSRSGVARQTLYRQFNSKQALALAFLAQREEEWTRAWLQAEVETRATEPTARLLAVFDVFDEWFRRPGFEGCSFINVMLEHAEADDPVRVECVLCLARIRDWLGGLARAAGAADPEGLAREWHILMKGSIVAAGEGDADAAHRGQRLGRLLLADEGLLPA